MILRNEFVITAIFIISICYFIYYFWISGMVKSYNLSFFHIYFPQFVENKCGVHQVSYEISTKKQTQHLSNKEAAVRKEPFLSKTTIISRTINIMQSKTKQTLHKKERLFLSSYYNRFKLSKTICYDLFRQRNQRCIPRGSEQNDDRSGKHCPYDRALSALSTRSTYYLYSPRFT